MLVVQRQFICRVLLVLPFIILLAGCAEPESETNYKQVKLEPGQVKQIKIGQTTQAEVESLLGKPTSTVKSHGQVEMGYYYNESDGGLKTVVTEPNVSVTRIWNQFRWERRVGGGTMIIIGKDGKVADIKWYTEIKDSRLHPDFTKVDQIQPGVTTEEQVNTLLGTPPETSSSWASKNSHFASWFYETGQFMELRVFFRQDGIVDEVSNFFKGARWFPKRVDADKVAQIKEQQSTRKSAESIFGRPQGINRNVQGSFYIYSIQMGKTKEVVYTQYDSSGVITRLIRKSQPEWE